MSAYKPYQHKLRNKFNNNNHTIIIAFNIKNIMLITDIIN